MKIQGQVVEGPKEEIVVIPRGTTEFVIKAKPVLNFDAFEKLNPIPQPREKMMPGGEKTQNFDDPEYKKALDLWAQQKTDWMILKSLSATEGLEWDTVDMAKPDTWSNYREELEKTFTPGEVSKIITIVMTACGLNQDKIDEATKRFLAGQAAG